MPEYELSLDNEAKCEALWDVYNTRSQELEDVADEADPRNRLTFQKEYVRENWDATAMLEYHLGNLTERAGVIQGATTEAQKGRFEMVREELVEQGIGLTKEALERQIKNCQRYIACKNREELTWAYIQNQYDFWDSLTDEELYEI